MNSSSGFQNNSLLGSSTGFKKRPLLRPPSGVLSKKLEFLRSIDLSQSQPVISTFLRGEVAAIEEEINLLDKDRRLRQGETGLQKGYVTALRKWLQSNQTFPERQDDDVKIMKYLGVDSYEGAFKKLWRVLGHLDLTISKITELQIIHFLLYDEMFNDLGKDSHRSNNLLSQISNNSYSPSTFQITQVLMERSKDIYAACRKGTSRQESRGNDDRKGRQQTNELIAQLKSENSKLNAMLEQLSNEREQQKKRLVEKESTKAKQNKSPAVEPNSASQHIKDIEEKYEEHIKYLNNEKNNAESKVNELKSKVNSLESQLKAAAESVPTIKLPSMSSGSYEEALMEQMDKMKKGFEKKIKIITDDFTTRERDLRRKEIEYKTENEKIKWEKSLLLKKFDILSK